MASEVSNQVGNEKRDMLLLYKYIFISRESQVHIEIQKVKEMNMHTPLEQHLTLHFLVEDLTRQSDHIKIFSHHLIGPICKICHQTNKKVQMKVYYTYSYCP